MDRKGHWETIYKTKSPDKVSWYQERPAQSLNLIKEARIGSDDAVIDVGGGASTLVDHLLAEKYTHVTVLDISREAMQKAKARLGSQASAITWIEGDITEVDFPAQSSDLWHDRAVFHFLTKPDERQRYVQALTKSLKPGGHVILATFALDGPPKCSGLEVMRYSAQTLADELGPEFRLLTSVEEDHRTPFETIQKFIYGHLVKI